MKATACGILASLAQTNSRRRKKTRRREKLEARGGRENENEVAEGESEEICKLTAERNGVNGVSGVTSMA
jgi:hypothetical protein